METIKKILFDILPIASPSGDEMLLLNKFASFMALFVDEVKIDTSGNVIAHKKGNGKHKIMLIAHSDEVALMVTYIDDKGFVYFQEVGAIDTNVLPEQKVEIHHGNKIVYGVVGKKPLHLQKKDEAAKDWEPDELWIDIGAKDKQDAEANVQVGDYITYRTDPMMLGNNVVTSKSLDDKTGIVALMAVAQRLSKVKIDDDIYFVASVQEELGGRGARTATLMIEPEIGIAVDVTHATDYPSMSPVKSGNIQVGGGVVIAKGPNVNKSLGSQLFALAKKSHLSLQIEPISHPTGTDANLVQVAGRGVKTALLSIPCRYMHMPNEVVSLTDIGSMVDLLEYFCQADHSEIYL